MSLTKEFLYHFLSGHRYAVLSTVTKDYLPECALVGFIVTKELKIFFDTNNTTRKYQNLINNPAIALVIGWENEQTVQFEGKVSIPTGSVFEELFEIYLNIFPDGQERRKLKDTVYFCVEPNWIRYSDFGSPVHIEELSFA